MTIVDVCKKMWQLGWVAANDGNVSVKLDNGFFLVTPSGISKGEVTTEKLVRINSEGDHWSSAQGSYKPSSEIKMHLRCYAERDDIGAVIHAHPPHATAFAIAGKPLDDYSLMEAVLSIGSVPVTPYATPSTQQVGDSIAPFLPRHDVVLLQNHGALAVGADLLTAFNRMQTLELWAKTVISAQALGGTQEISRENIDKLCSMRAEYGLTGKHPGYTKYGSG
jgi:L-fuculose-phosphate aldolase